MLSISFFNSGLIRTFINVMQFSKPSLKNTRNLLHHRFRRASRLGYWNFTESDCFCVDVGVSMRCNTLTLLHPMNCTLRV